MQGSETLQKGSCHCGKVRFELKTDLSRAVRCNCSLCRRKGAVILTATPGSFRFTSGEEFLSLYQFNTMTARHYFCRICGIYTHHNPRTDPSLTRVNAGCLDGIDPLGLAVELIDGASFSTV